MDKIKQEAEIILKGLHKITKEDYWTDLWVDLKDMKEEHMETSGEWHLEKWKIVQTPVSNN